MYAPFFGLQHPPFSIAPDPRYLFMSERHREALAHLLYGLDAGGGFVLLTGEVGAGKTTVCRCFLEQIPAHCNVAYIFNPKLTVGELLRSICDEFGVAHTPAVPGMETVKDLIDPLNDRLLAEHAAGRNNVLIIDEAQNLSADVLEQLRLLTNLETSERKLLQIILIGQPELRAMVASPPLEQLAQRVIARFHLDALTPQETHLYIAHRLSVAGLNGPLPFSPRAIRRVHALARGIPRRINLLCDRALLGAYAAGVREVGAAIVQRAAREVFDDAAVPWSAARGARQPLPRGVWAGLGALAGAAAMAAAAWGLRPEPWGAVGAMAAKPSMGDTAAAAEADTRRAARVRAAASGPASEVQVPRGASAPSATPLASFLARLPGTETSGLHALAGAWDVALAADADACAALARDGLRCYRNRRASLQLLRQLDRPVVLALHASAKPADAVYAVLRRLEGDTATLEGDGTTLQLSLQQLAQVWRGDMATLWRTPPGMPERGDLIDTAEGQAWLDRQLTAAPAGTAAADDRPVTQALRQSQIRRFQMAQGLTPDGRAGPLTLMLLNRVSGVNEPRLRTGN